MFIEINWYIEEHTCPNPVQNGVFINDIIILKTFDVILFVVAFIAEYSSCK